MLWTALYFLGWLRSLQALWLTRKLNYPGIGPFRAVVVLMALLCVSLLVQPALPSDRNRFLSEAVINLSLNFIVVSLIFLLATLLGQKWIIGRQGKVFLLAYFVWQLVCLASNPWHGLFYYTVDHCFREYAALCRIHEGSGYLISFGPLYSVTALASFMFHFWSIGLIMNALLNVSEVNRQRLIMMALIYTLPLIPLLRDFSFMERLFPQVPFLPALMVISLLTLIHLVLRRDLLAFPLSAWMNRSARSQQPTLCFSPEGRLIELNAQARSLFGVTNLNQSLASFCPALTTGAAQLEWAGREYQLHTEEHGPLGTVLTLSDITSQLQYSRSLANTNAQLESAQRRLRYEATHDPLTGLANRRELTRVLAELDQGKPHVCLVLGDIDDFRLINARYGHLGGDQILRQVARRIRDTFAPPALCCRYGGEEFCIVLPDSSLEETETLTEQLLSDFNDQPCSVSGEAVTVTLSFAVAGSRERPVSELLLAADHTLRLAKAGGKNRVARPQARRIWDQGWVC